MGSAVTTITTADVAGSANAVYGGRGDNRLVGNSGIDKLDGGIGNDTITGGANNDTLSGGTGDDSLDGEAGDDVLAGGDGNDTLQGGTGDDKLTGGAGSDVLDGGRGEDVLQGGENDYDQIEGGEDDDTFVFVNDWGYDVVTEANQIGKTVRDRFSTKTVEGSKDVLDFSRVTEPVTHILSGGTLVSGTGAYTLKKPQDELRGLNPLNTSTGNVTLRNVFVVDNMQSPKTGALSVVKGNDLEIASLKAYQSDLTFRMLLDRGNGSELVVLSMSQAEIDGLADLNALLALLNLKRQSATVGTNVNVDLSGNVAFTVNGKKLILTLAGTSVGVQILALDHSVLAGAESATLGNKNSQLQRFEEIKAANADNTFIFGDDWGEYGSGLGVPGIGSIPLGKYEPDLLTGLINFFGRNRTLEIEVEANSGNRTILDFRQSTKILAFNFFTEEDGSVMLEIEREEQWNYPFATIPIDLPIFRFNNIEITNIDENTIIYTGRKENLIRIDKGVNLRATVIGSGGLAPVQTLLSYGEVLESALAGRMWNVTASNLIDYTRFNSLRKPPALLVRIHKALPFRALFSCGLAHSSPISGTVCLVVRP